MANLTIDEIRLLAKLRNVRTYKNISRQQLENIFTGLSASTPALIPTSPSSPRNRPLRKLMQKRSTHTFLPTSAPALKAKPKFTLQAKRKFTSKAKRNLPPKQNRNLYSSRLTKVNLKELKWQKHTIGKRCLVRMVI